MKYNKNNDLQEKFVLMLEKIKTNADLYTTLVSENGDNKLSGRIISVCYEYVEADI